MRDQFGNEFTDETAHCWNCEHYEDTENSEFSWCEKLRAYLSMRQLNTMNPVTCVKFINKNKEKGD